MRQSFAAVICVMIGLLSCGAPASESAPPPHTQPAPVVQPAPVSKPAPAPAAPAAPSAAPQTPPPQTPAPSPSTQPPPTPASAPATPAAETPAAPAKASAATQAAPATPARVDALGDALPPGAVARLGTNRLHHPSGVVGLAFGADGKSLVTVDNEGTLREWSVPDGKLLRTFDAPREPTDFASSSRDAKVLALSRLEGDAGLIDGASGLARPPLTHGNRAVVSPDGSWLANWIPVATTVSIQPVGGGAVRDLIADVEEFFAVAFDPSGARVALLAKQRVSAEERATHTLVSLRDTASGDELWHATVDGEWLISATFSPDGTRLYAGDGHGVVHVFDGGSGEQLRTWKLASKEGEGYGVWSLAVSTDGQRLVAAHGRAGVLVDTHTGGVLHELMGDGPIRAVALSPDGSLVATGCDDGTARLFDARDGHPILAAQGHQVGIAQVLCAPGSRSICTIGADGACLLWPEGGSAAPRELLREPVAHVVAAFSPDGRTLAVGCKETEVRLYDVASASLRARWSTQAVGPVALLAFASDGNTLATLNFDDIVRLWPLADGKPAAEAPSLASQPLGRLVTAMTWLPDGRIAVGVNKVEFIDTQSGAVTMRLMDTTPIADMACTRDGKLLATADANQTATLYRLDDPAGPGSRPRQLGPHRGRVYAVAFSPDGKLLATAGANDASVHVWDVASGTEVALLASDGGDIRTLAFTADGAALVGGGDDPAALVWSMPPAPAPTGR